MRSYRPAHHPLNSKPYKPSLSDSEIVAALGAPALLTALILAVALAANLLGWI